MGSEYFEIVLLAFLAGFIALRLRSVLGRRPEGEDSPSDSAYGPAVKDARVDYESPEDRAKAEAQLAYDQASRFAGDATTRQGLEDIMSADQRFDPAVFLDGAQRAYQMILEAFWAGDTDEMKPYISDEINSSFAAAIDARNQADHRVGNRILQTSEMEISGARIVGAMTEVTVRFVSEIIQVTHDAEGRVVEGDANDAVNVTDLWTFSRETTNPDPNWTLVATRAG